MTNARIDDLEKRLTGLEKELRGGLEDLNSRMLSRFTDVDQRVEVVLRKLEGLTGRKRGIVRRSDDALLKRIRDVIWSYFFSSTWTIGATVKTEDARSADWREEVYREVRDVHKFSFFSGLIRIVSSEKSHIKIFNLVYSDIVVTNRLALTYVHPEIASPGSVLVNRHLFRLGKFLNKDSDLRAPVGPSTYLLCGSPNYFLRELDTSVYWSLMAIFI